MSAENQVLLSYGGSGGSGPPPVTTCVADEYYSCGPDCDPYWANVVLQLHGDASYADSSTYNRTPTVSGAGISTSFKKYGSGAMSIATGQNVTFTSSEAFGLGSGDFTIEFWVSPASLSSVQTIILGNSLSTPYWFFRSTATNCILFTQNSGGSGTESATALAVGQWQHIAVCRVSNTIQLYVNGIRDTSSGPGFTDSTDYTNQILYIGDQPGAGLGAFNGYIDDLRITKGIARYTGNFNIPTEAFPDCLSTAATPPEDAYYSDTLWWIRGEDELGNNTFVDSSPTRATVLSIASSGAYPVLSFNQKRQGKSAVQFLTTISRLRIEGDTSRDLGTSDFCFTGWIYITTRNDTSGIFSHRGPGVITGRFDFLITSTIDASPNRLKLFINDTPILTGSTVVANNQWYHVALTRSGNTFYAFLNGTLDGSGTSSASLTGAQRYALGGDGFNGFPWLGFIDDYRLIRGSAIYTSSFTPPDPLTGQFGRTILSLHAEDTTDSSCYQPKTIALTGSASVSTVEKKFGTSSFLVPNAGSSTLNGVTIADHQDFDFGLQDFTIELWAYRNANTYAGYLYYLTMGGEFSFVVGVDGLIDLTYRSSGGSQTALNVATFPLTQWNFIVVQRRGTNFEFYLNGVLTSSTAIAGGAASTVNSTGTHYLGRTSVSAATTWNGYIDEVRFTKGVARYTVGLPPTAQFPDSAPADPYWDDVTLQLHFENNLTDQKGNTFAADGTSFTTATTRFGTYALSVDGTATGGGGSNVVYSTGTTTDWDLNGGDFTIEGWMYFLGAPTRPRTLIRIADNSSTDGADEYRLLTDGGSPGTFFFGRPGAAVLDTGVIPTINTWFHLALCRSGNTYRMFVNGTLTNTVVDATRASAGAKKVFIGNSRRSFVDGHYGYIDDIRITKGVARYLVVFDPNALPNCDSTTTIVINPTENTDFVAGQAVTVGQGNLTLINRFARLSGQSATFSTSGLGASSEDYPPVPAPIGVSTTYARTESIVVTSGTNTTRTFYTDILFLDNGNFTIGGTGTDSAVTPWVSYLSALAATEYEFYITLVTSPPGLTTSLFGPAVFGTWFSISSSSEMGYRLTTTYSVVYGVPIDLQTVALNIQIRPVITSPNRGNSFYERNYTITLIQGPVAPPVPAALSSRETRGIYYFNGSYEFTSVYIRVAIGTDGFIRLTSLSTDPDFNSGSFDYKWYDPSNSSPDTAYFASDGYYQASIVFYNTGLPGFTTHAMGIITDANSPYLQVAVPIFDTNFTPNPTTNYCDVVITISPTSINPRKGEVSYKGVHRFTISLANTTRD